MKAISRVFSAMFMILIAAWSASTVAQTVYVSAAMGSDSNSGTSGSPFASLSRAQLAVQAPVGGRTQAAVVNIGQGTYYLPIAPTTHVGTYAGTLIFGTQDSGTSTFGVTWRADPSNTQPVVISGAVPVGTGGLGLTWTLTTGFSNVWQVTLPSTVGSFSLQPFEYLYYQPASSTGSSRRLRARVMSSSSTSVGYYWNAAGSPAGCYSSPGPGTKVSDSLCDLGTYLRVSNTVTPGTPLAGSGAGACPSVTDATAPIPQPSKCLDRFYYNTSDPITTWTNLNGAYDSSKLGSAGPPCDSVSGASTYPQGDVGLTLVDAWTVDSMRIACVDTTDGVIFLNAATKGNNNDYNYFGPTVGHRYIIENVRNALVTAANNGQTGLWFLDRHNASPVLYYIANGSEAPNSDTILIPQLPYSSQLSNQFPQMMGATELKDFVGGSLLWATGTSYVTFSNIGFQMDNFVPSYTTGFNNDVNGELSVPQAIDCEGCQNVSFKAVIVTHTSASGLLIASPPANQSATTAATNDVVQNSTFRDIGDSAIRLGHTVVNTDQSTYVVNNVTLNNNLIDGYSRVFFDGEGIAEGNGQTITISHNDITDGYHAGISIGQLGGGPFDGSGNGVNDTNVTSSLNHLWNLMQGVTSDGGSLYYNIGNSGGTGTGNVIDSNLVHDTTDSTIIDGGLGYKGTAYGGEGLYLDGESAEVLVENNVVFHMSGHTVHLTEGPSIRFASRPNTFENNIFSLAIQGMMIENNAWADNACPSTTPFTTAQFFWNIWNFDKNENPASAGSFSVVGGCSNSCGQPYYQFQDFEANAYYRANTTGTGFPLFCSDANAFHVLKNQSTTPPGSCPATYHQTDYDFLTFDSPAGGSATWQHGAPPSTPVVIDEDDGQDTTTVVGTCSWNPGFGTTGNPGDYTLTSAPNTQFNFGKTNNTISNAGRSPAATVPVVPETIPTYSYTNTQF